MASNKEWLCVECPTVLGYLEGGELRPAVDGSHCITRGPNLVVKCPNCGFVKTFYTSDPIVRAVYQLVDSMATVAGRRMVEVVAKESLERIRRDMKNDFVQ